MHELAIAASFVWLGMVVAISFIEAPIKFQAPGITIPLGLGIGRLVFKALNACEVVLAVCLVLGSFAAAASEAARISVVIAVVMLMVQVLGVRPALTRRTDAVLANPDAVNGPGSNAHLWYVGFEVVKVLALLVGGIFLLLPVTVL
ncbi:hypothetical protein [Nocardioides daejeonensis]|uniref:hypothetical protein n=1 Tax=Nocardioides daejeonensis TaxID=1046556 RepID=UPI000D74304D|nr:hypothetical protein [Nocardioides daejeonensis]